MLAIPNRYRHLQIFSVGLAFLLIALGFFLFAVKIEHMAAGSGIVFGGSSHEIVAPIAGRVQLSTGRDASHFKSLDLGTIGTTTQRLLEIDPLDGTPPKVIRIAEQEERQSQPIMIVENSIRDGAMVQKGQKLLTLVNLRNLDGEVEHPKVLAEFEEKQFAEVKVGQLVRVKSTMFPSRNHGFAEGVIASIRPLGVENGRGGRMFFAEVEVSHSPYPMLHGGSVQVEVLLGRKETFRVILEH